jgi:hypothetical protein
MSALQRRVAAVGDTRLAAITDTAANLKSQFCELNRLRDQIRKAQSVTENARLVLPPSSGGKERAMFKRRRFKQTESLQERLASFANNVREKASLLPPGADKDELLRKARQADTAAHLNEWANSCALQPPKLTLG